MELAKSSNYTEKYKALLQQKRKEFWEEFWDAILFSDKYDKEPEWLDDGFGTLHDPICPDCKTNSMQIVRPGKTQCYKCGG